MSIPNIKKPEKLVLKPNSDDFDPATFSPMLTAEENDEIEKEVRKAISEKLFKEKVRARRDEVEKTIAKELDPAEAEYPLTIRLPDTYMETCPHILLDSTIYRADETYMVPKRVLDALQDIMYRAWAHDYGARVGKTPQAGKNKTNQAIGRRNFNSGASWDG